MGTLDLLDELLRSGISKLGGNLRDVQLRYLRAAQQSDGGFPGRASGSDLYYTEFALRTLDLIGPDEACLRRARGFVARAGDQATDLVHCFSLLNSARILARHGLTVQVDHETVAGRISRQLLPGGGFAPRGGPAISAYRTFIAALCFELLERPLPGAQGAVAGVQALQAAGGGYAEAPGQRMAQTNATAAAVSFLVMQNALPEASGRAAAEFLAGMQADDGGVRAHAGAPTSDLLSTFTGLLTLNMLDAADLVDAGAVARFVKTTARAEGGFGASPWDDGVDVEYTYYGIATLALLGALLAASA